MPSRRDSPHRARGALVQLEPSVDRAALARVRLIVTELVASSVRHAHGGSSITLMVWSEASLLHAQVTDLGSGLAPDRPGRARLGPGAWTLVLIRRLADRWGALPDDEGIWFEVDTATARPRPETGW